MSDIKERSEKGEEIEDDEDEEEDDVQLNDSDLDLLLGDLSLEEEQIEDEIDGKDVERNGL